MQALLHREENAAPFWMTLALCGPGVLAAAVVVVGTVQEHLPWWTVLMGFLPIIIGYVIWRQFHVLLTQVDPEAVRLAFGVFTKVVPRSTITNVRVINIHLWNTGGLGIRRGWGYEAWVVAFGPTIEFTLQNGKRFLFTAQNPAVMCALLAKK